MSGGIVCSALFCAVIDRSRLQVFVCACTVVAAHLSLFPAERAPSSGLRPQRITHSREYVVSCLGQSNIETGGLGGEVALHSRRSVSGHEGEREGHDECNAAVMPCVPSPISLSGLDQTAEQRSCFTFGRLCLRAACDVQACLYTLL